MKSIDLKAYLHIFCSFNIAFLLQFFFSFHITFLYSFSDLLYTFVADFAFCFGRSVSMGWARVVNFA